MLNQFLLLGQSLEEKREIVSAQTQGNSVPESALERTADTGWFGASEYWFPEQASTFASQIDNLYMAIFWICTFFFIAIVAAMIYMILKYRRIGNEINPQPSTSHNTWIEIAWSVGPSLILAWIFWEGAVGWFDMRISPENAEEIQVTARKWNWQFTYPNGDISSELHLVMDRPVKLVMRSDDVLHSMFIPAFRQKVDIVPGRYTYAYIEPTKIGQYRLACTEYCGDEHSNMRTMCEVHIDDEDRIAKTMWETAEHAPWENGERLYKINCSGCHKVDGTAATGPALNLIWGEPEQFSNAEPIPAVDENYARESILYPNAKVVEGYSPKMNSFDGKLTDQDIDYLIAYLKYLKNGDVGGDDTAADDGTGSGESGTEEPATDPPAEGDAPAVEPAAESGG